MAVLAIGEHALASTVSLCSFLMSLVRLLARFMLRIRIGRFGGGFGRVQGCLGKYQRTA